MRPHLSLIHIYMPWLARELEKNGVAVHLNTKVTAAMLQESAQDEIILATGAVPRSLPLDVYKRQFWL